MTARSPITTHVLDTCTGRPAVGVPVSLSFEEKHNNDGNDGASEWKLLATGRTDSDGRVSDLLAPGKVEAGTYRMRFGTATYFARVGVDEFFYPHIEIVFTIRAPDQHHHVPLLLTPFGYSTYRGS